MKINQNKLKRQYELITAWKKNGLKGTVEAVTGFGKSYIALLIIQQMTAKFPKATSLIIVPTIKLKEQWEENIEAMHLPGVTVMVINSAVKLDHDVNLLVLDEIHRYASDVFQLIFQHTKYEYILGLTATMERKDQRHYMLEKYAPIIGSVDMVEALEKGYISDFSIFNLGLDMTFADQNRYRVMHDNFIKHFKFFDFDFNLAMNALKNQNLRMQIARNSGYTEKEVQIKAINFSRAMQTRKKFLYNNETKKETAKQLVERFKFNTITFAETTAFADELTEYMGKHIAFSYHSKLSKKKKAEQLARFMDPKDPLRIINTAKALDEGFDMATLEMAIICSGTSTPRQYIQRVGRTVRKHKDKTALIINLYLKQTQDERWLRGRGAMPNSIFIDDINEISYDEEIQHYRKAADIPRFALTGGDTPEQ